MKARLAAVALAGALASPASARIVASEGWVRATPPGAPTAAAYVALRNTGSRPDRLLGGDTAAAEHLGVHSMSMGGGVMRMRELDGLELPPGRTVRLAPSGDHLMLSGLKRPLRPGARADLTLRFEHAPPLRVRLPVRTEETGAHAH